MPPRIMRRPPPGRPPMRGPPRPPPPRRTPTPTPAREPPPPPGPEGQLNAEFEKGITSQKDLFGKMTAEKDHGNLKRLMDEFKRSSDEQLGLAYRQMSNELFKATAGEKSRILGDIVGTRDPGQKQDAVVRFEGITERENEIAASLANTYGRSSPGSRRGGRPGGGGMGGGLSPGEASKNFLLENKRQRLQELLAFEEHLTEQIAEAAALNAQRRAYFQGGHAVNGTVKQQLLQLTQEKIRLLQELCDEPADGGHRGKKYCPCCVKKEKPRRARDDDFELPRPSCMKKGRRRRVAVEEPEDDDDDEETEKIVVEIVAPDGSEIGSNESADEGKAVVKLPPKPKICVPPGSQNPGACLCPPPSGGVAPMPAMAPMMSFGGFPQAGRPVVTTIELAMAADGSMTLANSPNTRQM